MRIGDMVQLDVEYPELPSENSIPDEWLVVGLQELRKNLEHALRLETEQGGYGLNYISPILPDDERNDDQYQRSHGLSGSVLAFISVLERLVELDLLAAKNEVAAWPTNDDTIFSRLRIWAAGNRDLVSAETFSLIVASLSDSAFWSSYHQRDFLIVLAKRWGELEVPARKEIEDRLLRGRIKWSNEEDSEFEERRAWASLNRINWLEIRGCELTFNLASETKKLQRIAPEWKHEYATRTAESMEGHGGLIKTETEHSALLDEPLSNVLIKAHMLSGRKEDFLVENDPFTGLSTEKPIRAFSSIINAAKRQEYPEWAWRSFLNIEARKNDKPKFSAFIAEHIINCPDAAVAEFLHPTSDWVLSKSEHLASSYPQSFDKLLSKLINILRQKTSAGASSIIQGNEEPDGAMQSINAPTGKIAQALFKDPRTNVVTIGGGFPDEWLAQVNKLFSLKAELRRHALVIFAHNLNWLFAIDPKWTEANILSVLDKSDKFDRNAIWSGFFWGANTPDQQLYKRLKPNLLSFAMERGLPHKDYDDVLAGLILAGWSSTNDESEERIISNTEMRDVLLQSDDEFRSSILWRLERMSGNATTGSGPKWSDLVLELLRDVWPRQTSAKSPTISARLCDLAFSNMDNFEVMADIVLPLLTTISRDSLVFHKLDNAEDKIVNLYPEQTLSILHVVLPDNVALWPYGIEATLNRIGEIDEGLRSNEKLLELNRKWNAR
jgi:hypothetical protein